MTTARIPALTALSVRQRLDLEQRFVRCESERVAHAHMILLDGTPSLLSSCGMSRATPVHPDAYRRWIAVEHRACRRCVSSVGAASGWGAFDWLTAWQHGFGRPVTTRRAIPSVPDAPWPQGVTTWVTNNGWNRAVHGFDMSDELELSFCRLARRDDIEVREIIDAPPATVCRRCERLRAEAARLDPGPMTMSDLAAERNADCNQRSAVSMASIDASLRRIQEQHQWDDDDD